MIYRMLIDPPLGNVIWVGTEHIRCMGIHKRSKSRLQKIHCIERTNTQCVYKIQPTYFPFLYSQTIWSKPRSTSHARSQSCLLCKPCQDLGILACLKQNFQTPSRFVQNLYSDVGSASGSGSGSAPACTSRRLSPFASKIPIDSGSASIPAGRLSLLCHFRTFLLFAASFRCSFHSRHSFDRCY